MKKLLLILSIPISLLLVNCGGEEELQPVDTITPINPIEPPVSIYTYVPDNNFEQELINLGLDNTLNDTVLTAAIDTVTYLFLSSNGISDLTGIENFTALTHLFCFDNQLTSLDVSQNTALINLSCRDNQLTSLDVNGCTALTHLFCYDNQLTSLDVSQNTALTDLLCVDNLLTSLNVNGATALIHLWCNGNELTSLNVNGATALINLSCRDNQLTSLDLRNGNNMNLTLYAYDNPLLNCIDVDNVTWANSSNWDIPSQSFFSEDCGVK